MENHILKQSTDEVFFAPNLDMDLALFKSPPRSSLFAALLCLFLK